MRLQLWTGTYTSVRSAPRAIVAALAALTSGEAFASALVFTMDATHKVRPADAPGNTTSASIAAAQNEFEAFQVIVNGADTGAQGVAATMGPLTGPAGATLPPANVSVYREGYYQATQPSGPDGAIGAWPDALIPDVDTYYGEKRNAFPVDVAPGLNQGIWVEVLVPAQATPGTYTGSFSVTGTGLPGGVASVPVSLTVRGFALPSTPSLKTSYGMWWDGPCVAHYGSYEACGGDTGLEAIRDIYIRSALDHRITIGGAVYQGPVNGDWTHFDATYGALLNGTANTRLSGAALTNLQYVGAVDAGLATSWAQHFHAQGWFGALFDYTCDEPPATCAWTDIPQIAQVMKQADAAFRTLVTTTEAEAAANGVLSSVSILTPVVNDLDSETAGDTVSQYQSFVSGGNELWWYQSCMSHGCGPAPSTDPSYAGWPSYAIDTAAIRNRAQEWLSFQNGISNELYYETCLHLDTAWTNSFDFGGNGDGTLFYPGRPDVIGGTTQIPVESIRLKMIREGIEDYEYLKILSNLGEAAFAQQQAAALFPNAWASSSVDPAQLYAVREVIAQHIESHLGSATGGGSSTSGSSVSTGTATTTSAGSAAATGGPSAASAATGTGGGATSGAADTATSANGGASGTGAGQASVTGGSGGAGPMTVSTSSWSTSGSDATIASGAASSTGGTGMGATSGGASVGADAGAVVAPVNVPPSGTLQSEGAGVASLRCVNGVCSHGCSSGGGDAAGLMAAVATLLWGLSRLRARPRLRW